MWKIQKYLYKLAVLYLSNNLDNTNTIFISFNSKVPSEFLIILRVYKKRYSILRTVLWTYLRFRFFFWRRLFNVNCFGILPFQIWRFQVWVPNVLSKNSISKLCGLLYHHISNSHYSNGCSYCRGYIHLDRTWNECIINVKGNLFDLTG